MKKSIKSCDPMDAIGIFVEFETSDDAQFHYKLQIISVYRVKLRISLPIGKEKAWPSGIAQIIRKVETGASWPLRFEYNNVVRYISLEDLATIEKALAGPSAYVYEVPAEKASFSEKKLQDWFNAAQRAAYQVKTSAAAALEGQICIQDL